MKAAPPMYGYANGFKEKEYQTVIDSKHCGCDHDMGNLELP